MPVDKESKFALLIGALKEWVPTLRVHVGTWWEACRAEPILFWNTPAIRYGTYGLGGVLVVCFLSSVMGLFAPGGPEPLPQARTADFHVICSNAACGAQFVIQRPFEFDDFPVTCRKCTQETGARAMRCFSASCKGKWVATQTVDDAYRCRTCNALLGRAD